MTKDKKHLTSVYSLKFNDIQIKLDLNGIVLIKNSYIGSIFLFIDYNIDFTSSKTITRKKLSFKK